MESWSNLPLLIYIYIYIYTLVTNVRHWVESWSNLPLLIYIYIYTLVTNARHWVQSWSNLPSGTWRNPSIACSSHYHSYYPGTKLVMILSPWWCNVIVIWESSWELHKYVPTDSQLVQGCIPDALQYNGLAGSETGIFPVELWLRDEDSSNRTWKQLLLKMGSTLRVMSSSSASWLKVLAESEGKAMAEADKNFRYHIKEVVCTRNTVCFQFAHHHYHISPLQK